MRSLRGVTAAAGAVLVTALIPATGPASAGSSDVEILIADNAYSRPGVRIDLGDDVRWDNTDPDPHTTTSDQGFWDSGSLTSGGDPYIRVFTSAGKFRYHCTFHAHMHGRVTVDFRVVGGSAARGWVLRWATVPAAEGLGYDVTYRKVGTTRWRPFRRDTAGARGLFDPARNGDYQVRTRTTNLVEDLESGWAPIQVVRIR